MNLSANPLRAALLAVGVGLARLGLVDERRVGRIVDLSWPRVLTGLVRTTRTTADVAMVGLAVGPASIAGIGYAAPFAGAAFVVGGGLATAASSLVAQRYGADTHQELGEVVRTSALVVVVVLVPVALVVRAAAAPLVGVLSPGPDATRLGARYLRLLVLAVPFAGLNRLGSRTLTAVGDAHTPMVVRSAGAVLNGSLTAVFVFGLGWGVEGAAFGSAVSAMVVTATFALGLVAGRLPGLGSLPVSVRPRGRYLVPGTARDLVTIGLPVVGRNTALTAAQFPMLAVVGWYGGTVAAAYVVSWRLARLLNAPGWGFGTAASSLVGRHLGAGSEAVAAACCRDILRTAVVTYAIVAGAVFVFARPVVGLFVTGADGETGAVAVPLVRAACVGVVLRGVTSSVAGALDASGDTRWPFYGRVAGTFGLALPLAALGATTPLGLWGLYLAYVGQTLGPATVNYHRFRTGAWQSVSREYRPEAGAGGD